MNSPISGEPGVAEEIAAFFPHFFHKPAHTLVTTGKDLFYFFKYLSLWCCNNGEAFSVSVKYRPVQQGTYDQKQSFTISKDKSVFSTL